MKESDLEKVLDNLNRNISAYYKLDLDDLNGVNECMKNIGVINHYLTKERVDYWKNWNNHIFEKVNEGMSKAAAENSADQAYPELYSIRRIQDSTQLLLKGIISHFSRLKQEQND